MCLHNKSFLIFSFHLKYIQCAINIFSMKWWDLYFLVLIFEKFTLLARIDVAKISRRSNCGKSCYLRKSSVILTAVWNKTHRRFVIVTQLFCKISDIPFPDRNHRLFISDSIGDGINCKATWEKRSRVGCRGAVCASVRRGLVGAKIRARCFPLVRHGRFGGRC